MTEHGHRFAAKVQIVLIAAMMAGFIMILQQFNFIIYRIGLAVLIASVLVQIPFGNIPPESGFARSMGLFARYFVIVIVIFAIGIVIAPFLVELGRG
jgi:predicted PurR-regulated permease PerM